MLLIHEFQVIAASGGVKHEDLVEQVKLHFTKLSTDPTTAAQLVAKEPATFTGSEVCLYLSVHYLSSCSKYFILFSNLDI